MLKEAIRVGNNFFWKFLSFYLLVRGFFLQSAAVKIHRAQKVILVCGN